MTPITKDMSLEPSSLNVAMSELEAILEEAGPDIRQLFGPALTIFAGAQAGTRSSEDKHTQLELLITRASGA